MTELQTARLRLDRLSRDDLGALHEIQSDPKLWLDDPGGVHSSVEQTEELFAAIERAWSRSGLGLRAVRSHDELLGTCGVMPFYFGGRRVWNLGYRLRRSVHGQGVATEAAAAALEEMRREHPDEPVIGRAAPGNAASRRVLEKVGLAELRRRPGQVLYADRELDPHYADLLADFG